MVIHSALGDRERMRLLIATVLGLALILIGLPASAQAAEAYGPVRSEDFRGNHAEVSGEFQARNGRVEATALASYTGDKKYCGLARMRATTWLTKKTEVVYASTCDRMIDPAIESWVPEITQISMIEIGTVEVSACLALSTRVQTPKDAIACGPWEALYDKPTKKWGPVGSGEVDDQSSWAVGTVLLEGDTLSLTAKVLNGVSGTCVAAVFRITSSTGSRDRTSRVSSCQGGTTVATVDNRVKDAFVRVCLFTRDDPDLFRCGAWTKIA